MMTVKEVSRRTGVSIRTLHHYDKIGLLPPDAVTQAGYRLYDDTALERLQQILLFRELEFSLQEIKDILERPDFNRQRALEQQVTLLTLKKEHLENLIDLAVGIKACGVKKLDFTAFDTQKIDAYAAQAKETWGSTDAYKEYEKKTKSYTKEDWNTNSKALMAVFTEFGACRQQGLAPDSAQALALAKKLQDTISTGFYTCTPEILKCLGGMYAGGGDFTSNIDKAAGEGTAVYASQAIDTYCGRLPE